MKSSFYKITAALLVCSALGSAHAQSQSSIPLASGWSCGEPADRRELEALGRCPSENLVRQQRFSVRPVAPAPSSASPETSSSECSSSASEIERDHGLQLAAQADRPPTTLVPPPKTTAILRCATAAERGDLVVEPGSTPRPVRPARRDLDVAAGRASTCRPREAAVRRSSTPQCAAPTMSAASRSRQEQRRGSQPDLIRLKLGER